MVIMVCFKKMVIKGCDREISEMGFKVFINTAKDSIVRNTSKLNWKRDLLGVKLPHRVIDCEKCQKDKTCPSCEIDPKLNCFDCEISRSCDKYLKRITQIKLYSTEINKLKKSDPMEMVICYPTMLEKIL